MHRFHILHIFRDFFCNFEINGYFHFFFFWGGVGVGGGVAGVDIGSFYLWNRIFSYNLFLFSLKYHPKA